MAPDDRRHPDAEQLAEYADGLLSAEASADVARHLVECADCRAVVADTMDLLIAGSGGNVEGVLPARVIPFRSRRWVTGVVAGLAAAAAIVLVVRVERPAWLFGRGDRPELQELIAAVANEPTRPVEGRLSGGFKYGPPPSAARGSGEFEASPDVRIAAARIDKHAQERDTPENLAAAGLAALSIGHRDRAVDLLEQAAQGQSRDGGVQTDLSAAYLARAAWDGRAEDWPKALTAAERAIALSPRTPEAHFNRALALEGLHLDGQAIEAWNEYRALDPGSDWAKEADERLRRLRAKPAVPVPPTSPLADNQTLREYTEDDLLARWARAVLSKDSQTAATAFDDATAAAERLASRGGDSMARDEVARIGRARRSGDPELVALATAHVGFAAARQAYMREDLKTAQTLMATAARDFAKAGSPYAWWAGIYTAVLARVARRPQDALDELRRIPVATLPESYVALRGRYTWTEAVAQEALGRLDVGRRQWQDAARIFERGGELENLSATLNYAAEASWLLGDQADAWDKQIRSLRDISRLRPGTRRNVLLLNGAFFALNDGMPEAALHFQDSLMRSIAHEPASVGAPDGYMQRARIYYRLGNHVAALKDLEAAERTADEAPDAALRARNHAAACLLAAELFQVTDSRRALAKIDEAVTYYRASPLPGTQARPLILRARIKMAEGDADGAAVDLRAASEAFEADRQRLASPRDRIQAFELERAALRASVQVEIVGRRDSMTALQVAERGRAQGLFGTMPGAAGTLDPLIEYRRLPRDLAIIYYSALDDRLVTWVLTNDRIVMLPRQVPTAAISPAIARMRRLVANDGSLTTLAAETRPLYDELIRPALDAAPGRTTLVFVPDGILFGVPFGAIPDDQHRPLLSTHVVAIAPSLTALVNASARLHNFDPSDVLAIGDGHDPRLFPLPVLESANQEAAEIGALYPANSVLVGRQATRAKLLDARQAVLHFAGHTVVNERYAMFSHLLLAPDADGDGMLTADDLVAHQLSRVGVAVLGTCEGAVGRVIDGEGALSMAEMFMRAGVPSIVASLWPVDDRSHRLLVTFHQELRRLKDPASALRAAQVSLLSASHSELPVRVWGGFMALGAVHWQ